jgi:hypothetical protein
MAFSCKRRGFCPSCGARRMAESAALLVDEVLPHAPMRQWVLSVTFPLQFLFATQPAIMGNALRIVYRTIATHLILKRCSRAERDHADAQPSTLARAHAHRTEKYKASRSPRRVGGFAARHAEDRERIARSEDRSTWGEGAFILPIFKNSGGSGVQPHIGKDSYLTNDQELLSYVDTWLQDITIGLRQLQCG